MEGSDEGEMEGSDEGEMEGSDEGEIEGLVLLSEGGITGGGGGKTMGRSGITIALSAPPNKELEGDDEGSALPSDAVIIGGEGRPGTSIASESKGGDEGFPRGLVLPPCLKLARCFVANLRPLLCP
eukprot:10223687-Ditylum_brightwellii.AAC.1